MHEREKGGMEEKNSCRFTKRKEMEGGKATMDETILSSGRFLQSLPLWTDFLEIHSIDSQVCIR